MFRVQYHVTGLSASVRRVDEFPQAVTFGVTVVAPEALADLRPLYIFLFLKQCNRLGTG